MNVTCNVPEVKHVLFFHYKNKNKISNSKKYQE